MPNWGNNTPTFHTLAFIPIIVYLTLESVRQIGQTWWHHNKMYFVKSFVDIEESEQEEV